MSAPRRATRSSEESRTSRLVAALVAKVFGAGLAIFLLLGIAAPNLVDLHQDVALAGAVLCLVLAAVCAAWALRQILIDRRKIAVARRQCVLPPQ